LRRKGLLLFWRLQEQLQRIAEVCLLPRPSIQTARKDGAPPAAESVG
jgi:hypothetical protein